MVILGVFPYQVPTYAYILATYLPTAQVQNKSFTKHLKCSNMKPWHMIYIQGGHVCHQPHFRWHSSIHQREEDRTTLGQVRKHFLFLGVCIVLKSSPSHTKSCR